MLDRIPGHVHNMRQSLAFLWTFELLLHFDQLFSPNLQSEDELSTNYKHNYLSEYVLCSKDYIIVTEVHLRFSEKDKKNNIF